MRPSDRSFAWTLEYDSTADQGRGEITVALDDDRVSVPLDDGVRAVGASYDRFGIVSYQRGGHHVEIWLDDLQYTTGLAR